MKVIEIKQPLYVRRIDGQLVHVSGSSGGAGADAADAIVISDALARAAPDLCAVVADMLGGLEYLRQRDTVPYGFGIDRLERIGYAALDKVGITQEA